MKDIELRRAVLKRDGWRCFYCDTPVRRYRIAKGQKGKPPADMATVDHIIPVAEGGKAEYGNLVAACYKCNQRRGVKAAAVFLCMKSANWAA